MRSCRGGLPLRRRVELDFTISEIPKRFATVNLPRSVPDTRLSILKHFAGHHGYIV